MSIRARQRGAELNVSTAGACAQVAGMHGLLIDRAAAGVPMPRTGESRARDAVQGVSRSGITQSTHQLDDPIVLSSGSRAAAETARRPQRCPCCCCSG